VNADIPAAAFWRAMAARNQARRLPAHYPQERQAGEAIYSRPGNDLTYRFPLIVEALAKLRSQCEDVTQIPPQTPKIFV
jgi:hypothetical protein